MEALFLALMLPKIGGAFTLKDNLVMKRFSVKELRQWIMEMATEAIQGDSFKTGTVFYKTLPGGVSAVISWSEYGDYVEGIAYVTKERYDKMCGRTDVNWRQYALECIDEEVKSIGMWMWGDVKGFILEEKVSYTKQYHNTERKDEESFDWEQIDSCWGYFMETEELIAEVISEHDLKEERKQIC